MSMAHAVTASVAHRKPPRLAAETQDGRSTWVSVVIRHLEVGIDTATHRKFLTNAYPGGRGELPQLLRI
jgi:hypothetical protein